MKNTGKLDKDNRITHSAELCLSTSNSREYELLPKKGRLSHHDKERFLSEFSTCLTDTAQENKAVCSTVYKAHE